MNLGIPGAIALTFLAGCSGPATPEGDNTDANIAAGTYRLAGGWTLELDGAGMELVGPGGRQPLADLVIGEPSLAADGERFAFTERPGRDPFSRIRLGTLDDGGWSFDVVVGGAHQPDQVALSPDGELLAFASSASGLASIWLVEADPGARPIQLTNVGVQVVPGSGGPPPGFVPPPVRGAPRFVGDRVEWDAQDGVRSVEVPR